jgi:thymidylate synthase
MQEGFPLLTTKAISWKNIVIENLWFLSGSQDIKFLQRHNCKFWDPWADSQGKVPSAYGNFWRHFPVFGTRDSSDIRVDGDPCLAYNDQIRWVLGEMRRNPMSRRMVVSAWAPENAQYSKLPPCHCLYIFNVQNDVPNPNDKPWEVVANYSFLGGTDLC